jgi:hypothetical protein
MKKRRSITEKPALDVIDEAFALLRRCPLQVGALYYIGAIPFVLTFLYFWADMSRGAFAQEHLVQSSLVAAISFIWCKFWQALFGVHLLAEASHRPLPRWTWQGLLQVAVAQTAIQSTGLFIVPIALLITIPFGAVYSFYQNVSILALDGQGAPQEGAALRREAIGHARRWPGQNHVGLATLFFFWLIVLLNVMVVILSLPWMLKTFAGIETMFSRSLFRMFNTTFFALAGAISYLCVDPIMKAFYTMRCFHGRALATGEDLRIEIRTFTATRVTGIAAVLLLCFAGISRGDTPAPSPAPPAHAEEIDQSISKVLDRAEFAWRAPREAGPEEKQGWVNSFVDGAGKMIKRWMRPLGRWITDFFRWLGQHTNHEQDNDQAPGRGGWESLLKIFAWLFCIVAVCALGVMAWKMWLRRSPSIILTATATPVAPDLNSEEISADQLPEDEWLGLAREMIAKGDFRLALRAFYLAALAHLGERGIISIARHKSNRDYQKELRRRRPGQGELITTFADTVRIFERSWYGMHDVTQENLAASEERLEKIRQN